MHAEHESYCRPPPSRYQRCPAHPQAHYLQPHRLRSCLGSASPTSSRPVADSMPPTGEQSNYIEWVTSMYIASLRQVFMLARKSLESYAYALRTGTKRLNKTAIFRTCCSSMRARLPTSTIPCAPVSHCTPLPVYEEIVNAEYDKTRSADKKKLYFQHETPPFLYA